MQPRPTDLVRRTIPGGDRRRGWIWVSLGALAAALCVGWLVLPIDAWAAAFERWMLGLGIWGIAIFAAAFIAATLVLAPDWPLVIAAGMVYGIGAFPVIVAAATIAASLAFLIARHLLRERIRDLLAGRRKFAAIDNAITEEGWKIVFLLRLSPLVPFNVQNYLFGITDIPFPHYLAATCVGIIPGAALFVYLGALGRASGGPLEWGFFGVGLLATAIVVLLVARKAKAKLARAGVDNHLP
jgi:uncharacterized membrane protein YdjX (TVP38/TMEM64 family)